MADVTQYKLQIASLEAQVVRDKAEWSGAEMDFPRRDDPDSRNYAALQRALYDQRQAQYVRRLRALMPRSVRPKRRSRNCKRTTSVIHNATKSCKRSRRCERRLAESGTGSQLNMYHLAGCAARAASKYR